jgi:hypothetical protein
VSFERRYDMSSLGEELPKEQKRVRELITEYRDPLLRGAGNLAAMMMEQALQRADRASVSGDVVLMIRSYEELKGWVG